MAVKSENFFPAHAATDRLLAWLNARSRAEDPTAETVHQCPPKGSGIMPCCGRTPFETLNDRMTLDRTLVTCHSENYTERWRKRMDADNESKTTKKT